MPEAKKTEQEELNDLRERVKWLEAELKKEKEKKEQEKKDKQQLTDSFERLTDEVNRLSRGFFFAGMEAMAVAADMTKVFVEKTSERNTAERRDTVTKLMTNLPVDMAKGFVDALDESSKKTEKVVDKFYEKYKEK